MTMIGLRLTTTGWKLDHTIAIMVLTAGIPLAFMVFWFVCISIVAPIRVGICVVAFVGLAGLPRLCLAVLTRLLAEKE